MLLEFADNRSTQIWAIKKLIFSLINEMLIKQKFWLQIDQALRKQTNQAGLVDSKD